MPTFYFQREARTATSECYTVMEDAAPVGRLDIHFAPPVIHCTLVVAESVTTEGIQDLVEMVGEDLIDAVGIIPPRFGTLQRPGPRPYFSEVREFMAAR